MKQPGAGMAFCATKAFPDLFRVASHALLYQKAEVKINL
jgi:hypothetical protein